MSIVAPVADAADGVSFDICNTQFTAEAFQNHVTNPQTFQTRVAGIYCPPSYRFSHMLIIEMNNTLDSIEGIILCKVLNRVFSITDKMNRETMIGLNPALVDILDDILFQGETHCKCREVCTFMIYRFPESFLTKPRCQGRNIHDELVQLFFPSPLYVLK